MSVREPLTPAESAWLRSAIDQRRRQLIADDRTRTGTPRPRKRTYLEVWREKHQGAAA